MKRKLQRSHAVTAVIHGTQCGERREHLRAHPALVGLQDAHYVEGDAADVHMLPDEILRLVRQQFFRLVFADHQHLSHLAHVDIVDEASVAHLALADGCIVGVHTRQLCADVVLAKADGDSALRQLGTYLVDVAGELTAGSVEIGLPQLNGAAFLQSVVGLRGLSTEYLHGVGEEASRVLRQGIDKSVAGAKQEDEHEDSPRHSKSC